MCERQNICFNQVQRPESRPIMVNIVLYLTVGPKQV